MKLLNAVMGFHIQFARSAIQHINILDVGRVDLTNSLNHHLDDCAAYQRLLKTGIESSTGVLAVQTGLPIPYILEPYRTVPCIFEPNRLPARNFRARAEPNLGPNARARQCMVRIVYEPNRINLWNARFGTVRLADVRLKVI